MRKQPDSSDDVAANRDRAPQVPTRRRGGQELPDNVQDRPEQNAGYDAAVRGEGTGTPIQTRHEAGVLGLDPRQPRANDVDLEVIDPDREP